MLREKSYLRHSINIQIIFRTNKFVLKKYKKKNMFLVKDRKKRRKRRKKGCNTLSLDFQTLNFSKIIIIIIKERRTHFAEHNGLKLVYIYLPPLFDFYTPTGYVTRRYF